jgi:hypothetical protein
MPSYFDRFGMPDMSIHVMNRLHQRHVSLAALTRALTAEPTAGTTPETLVYRERGGGVSVIVNAVTGRIITVWRE